MCGRSTARPRPCRSAIWTAPGATAFHHHTREQADVQLAGTAEIKVGDRAEPFPSGSGIVAPADVAHSFTNRGSGTITLLEFHAVPRPDLVPPRPKVTFPAAEEAVSVPAGQQLVTRVDVADGKTPDGRTSYVRWRPVTESIDVHPAATPTELFVYGEGERATACRGTNDSIGRGNASDHPGPARPRAHRSGRRNTSCSRRVSREQVVAEASP